MTEHLLEGKCFEGLLESATDSMIIIDREGRIIVANPPIEQLGNPMEILLPQRFRHTHHIQRTDYFAQPHARTMGNWTINEMPQ